MGLTYTIADTSTSTPMRSPLLPALAIALIASLDTFAATPPVARYTRVEGLTADMEHVTARTEEGAFLRLVLAGDDGIYHVCVVANNAMKVVRMTGQYSDSTLAVAHGEFIYYHANGRKESNGVFVNGVKSGLWVRWNATGEQVATKQYIGLAGDALNEHLGLSSTATTLPPPPRRDVSAMAF